NFLGFTHICGRSRHGKFLLKRKSRRDRMRGKLKEIKGEMRHRMHQSIPEQGRWLAHVVRGYLAYHAVAPTPHRSEHSAITGLPAGAARCRDAVSTVGSRVSGSSRSLITGFLGRKSFFRGRSSALPSDTRGRSRMPELGSYGSVRGLCQEDAK